MALIMHRLLEKELGKAGPNLSAERITEALSEARLQELVLGEKETYYAKSNTEGDFEAVAKAVGLGALPRVAVKRRITPYHSRFLIPYQLSLNLSFLGTPIV